MSEGGIKAIKIQRETWITDGDTYYKWAEVNEFKQVENITPRIDRISLWKGEKNVGYLTGTVDQLVKALEVDNG